MKHLIILSLLLLSLASWSQEEDDGLSLPDTSSEELLPPPEEAGETEEAPQSLSESESSPEMSPEPEVIAPAPKRTAKTKSVKTKVRRAKPKTSLWQIGPRLMTWQERVDANDITGDLTYRARFTAFGLGFSHKGSLGKSPRWIQSYNGDFLFGSVKASGISDGEEDILQSQSFIGLQGHYAIHYRTSNISMLGFHVPLFFRQVNWDLTRSDLSLGNKTLISLGLGLSSSWRLSSGSFLNLGLTYRESSALWTLSYDIKI